MMGKVKSQCTVGFTIIVVYIISMVWLWRLAKSDDGDDDDYDDYDDDDYDRWIYLNYGLCVCLFKFCI